MKTHRIHVGLGSNVERELHLQIVLHMLEEHLEGIRCSPVFESPSPDAAQPPFFNLVIAATTRLSVRKLLAWFKELERLHGRNPANTRLIPLDIDLLLFDDMSTCIEGVTLPSADILTRAYVLYPLQLLAPSLRHPALQCPLAELWQQLQPGPALTPVRYPFACPA